MHAILARKRPGASIIYIRVARRLDEPTQTSKPACQIDLVQSLAASRSTQGANTMVHRIPPVYLVDQLAANRIQGVRGQVPLYAVALHQ